MLGAHSEVNVIITHAPVKAITVNRDIYPGSASSNKWMKAALAKRFSSRDSTDRRNWLVTQTF